MRVLVLGNGNSSPLSSFIRESGQDVIEYHGPLTPTLVVQFSCEFLISYCYRHIIPRDVLQLFGPNTANLHISYLPWNRGADPNLWSFLTNTPSGVTIHAIDEGVDTGPIYIQKKVFFDPENETLKTTYLELCRQIELLFEKYWTDIVSGNIIPQPQQKNEGSYHRLKDKDIYCHLITNGWDTPIKTILGKYNAIK